MEAKQRIVPFGEFPMEDNYIQISVLTPDENGCGYFNVEKPDVEYGFKSTRITYPDLQTVKCIGFTDAEILWIKSLLKDNMNLVNLAGEYSYA